MRLRIRKSAHYRITVLGIVACSASSVWAKTAASGVIAPSQMSKIATVDPEYVSYNVEMVEVTGGRFWKPFKPRTEAQDAAKLNSLLNANQQVGDDKSLFEYRQPIDLSNARLRRLAAALGPAYVRVSGSWANSTYFQDDDRPALKAPPEGFRGVLTRAEWKGVVDFSNSVNAKIVTSVAVSTGVRDANGAWQPSQAKALFDYTKQLGSSIAASEFMNEPTIPGPGGAPAGYNAEMFGKDVRAFKAFLPTASPKTIFLGPGSIGEGVSLMSSGMQIKMLATDDLMKAAGPAFDAFSYHFYGTVSRRCMGTLKIDQALSAEWLDRTNAVEAFYAALRDKYLAGKPMWLNETAEAACGGDEFASQFVDSFRFLNQLGTLAQKGVKVVMHNTLAASDYGLLDETTFEPRPNYWAALLWKRTMGTTVLDPGFAKDQPLRVYAHCLKDTKGGVAMLVLNTDTKTEHTLEIPVSGDRYTLSATDLTSRKVLLNGSELRTESDGAPPALKGQPVSSGTQKFAPESITFLTMPSAANASCR